jgi:hypothetical protein
LASKKSDDDLDSDSDIDISDGVPPPPQTADTPLSEDEETQSDTSSLAVLPDPIWVDGVHFESEGMYTCSDCAAEVVEGHCFLCGLEHQWEVITVLPCLTKVSVNERGIFQDDPHQNRATTDTQAIDSERSSVPRGNTPLLEVDEDFSPPLEYKRSRIQEYMELLKRGATRLMCETFHLEYTYDKGIFAWADPLLYEEFAGPAMRKGDFWKIQLGRRVLLDDDDLDGSAFLEGLLEDALYFPLRGNGGDHKFEKWETVEETSGIWVTRLQDRVDEDGDDDSDDGSIVRQREDEALENSGVKALEDTVKVIIRLNEYDISEDSEEDDYEMDDLDPGYSWEANIADAVWTNSEESDEDYSDDLTMYGTESNDSGSDMDSVEG